MAALTSALMMTGWVYSRPPLTMRWPTTSISDLSDTARAAPEVSASSNCAVASSRVPDVISSLQVAPDELLISSVARSPCHSIFPSHSGSGGISGKVAPSSYSDALLATGAGIENQDFHSVRPFPVADFGHVVAVLADVLLVLDQAIADASCLKCAPTGCSRGTRSTTSPAR